MFDYVSVELWNQPTLSASISPGESAMNVPTGTATSDPSMIPVEMVIPMKAPTCPFYSPSTAPGAFIAQSVLR